MVEGYHAPAPQRPTHFVTMVTPNDEAIERQLIIELAPVANKKIG